MVLAIVGGLVAVLLAVTAVASALATRRFRALYEAERDALLEAGRAMPAKAWDEAAAAALPPPVRRFLQVTGAYGKPCPRTATLKQTGGIRTGRDKAWMPFEAEQVYSMNPPGFVWLAKADMAPGMFILARDKFVGGAGAMLIKLEGLVTVADATGPEMDAGAALRHWGEALSFPELALDPHLRWEAIDDRRAGVRIVQDPLDLKAVIEFGDDGLPVATHADRFRDVNGRSVITPWTGRMHDWKNLGGRLFPTKWESIWHLPEGDFEAVRIEVHSVSTD